MSEDINLKRIDSLINKIWITRKARIKAEERLEKFDFLTQILVNYYTLVVTGLSIWTLYDASNAQLISVISIIASVLLFGLSIFVTSRNFKGRSLGFKSCYIKLDEIYNEAELIKGIPTNLTIQNISLLQMKYNEIMNSVENHTTIDFLNVLSDTNNISNSQYLQLLWRKIISTLVIILIVLFPLFLVYLVTKGVK